jgi:hypothetical protein
MRLGFENAKDVSMLLRHRCGGLRCICQAPAESESLELTH